MNNESNNDNSCKVFDSCRETHVYPNPNGEIVIRQIDSLGDECFIFIPIHYSERVVSAIRETKRRITQW